MVGQMETVECSMDAEIIQRLIAHASRSKPLVKKSSVPKLPDLSATCSTPASPCAWHQGTSRSISGQIRQLTLRCQVPVMLRRVGGGAQTIEAVAAVETRLEVELLRAGGVIPSSL